MGKMYALDGKYLTDRPEVRIGDKVYAVDDRVKTVRKLFEIQKQENNDFEAADKALELVFGKEVYREISNLDLPYKAYQKLFELVIEAVTGAGAEEETARFPESEQ